MTKLTRSLPLLVAALAAFSAGCSRQASGPGRPSSGRQVTLNGAGASFPYPLYSKWTAEYAKVAAEVRVNYQSIGSGGGIQQLKAGTVDFGASDAPLSDQELTAMPRPVVHFPTTAGAVAVVYRLPELKAPLRLSGAALAAIYLGEITRWDDKRLADLNPDLALPKSPIAVTRRSDGSGTSYVFTSYLAAVSKPWADKVGAGKAVEWPVGIGAKGNEGVAGMVKQTAGSIGYVELAYATQNSLPVVHLQNPAGEFVAPSVASVAAAVEGAAEAMQKDVRISIINAPGENAYPLAAFTYLLVYRDQADPDKAKALIGFLEWAMHDGQAFAEPLSYAPLPAEIVAINEQALKTITVQGRS